MSFLKLTQLSIVGMLAHTAARSELVLDLLHTTPVIHCPAGSIVLGALGSMLTTSSTATAGANVASAMVSIVVACNSTNFISFIHSACHDKVCKMLAG